MANKPTSDGMEKAGVFAVARGVFDHPLFADEPFSEREAWIWLVGEAAWRPTRARVGRAIVTLARGQLAHSTRFMAAKWKWSEARVRRFLARLKEDAMIDVKTDALATQITICNYDAYQKVGMPTDAEATQRRRSSDAEKKQGNKEEDTSSLRSDVAREEPDRPQSKKGTRLPAGWQPSEADVEYAVSKGVPRDKVPELAEEYRNYWLARPGRDGVKLDWSATWRNRVLQVCERRGWQPFGQPNSQAPPPTKTWVECDDPRWSSFAERHREEYGKPLTVMTLRSKGGPGNYVPNEWLAH